MQVNMSRFAILWFVITILFLFLTILSFSQTFKVVNPLPQRSQVGAIMGLSVGGKETVQDINNFIDEFNRMNRTTNIAKSIGYLATTVTALFSFIVSLKQSQALSAKNTKEDQSLLQGQREK
jgi:hypothetical protein